MDNERRCTKCKYSLVDHKKPPCLGCIGLEHHPNFEPKETKPDRSCTTCEFERKLCTAYPCSECYTEEFHPNYRPKQVYISTADNRKNDLLDAARYAMQIKDMDVASFYPMDYWNSRSQLMEYIERDIKSTLNLLERVEKEKEMKEPKKVIFNDPATIVFWHDGTKTIVKAIDEPFDPEKGLAMAIAKKYLGNEGNYYNTFKKWLPKEEEEIDFEIKIIDPSELKKLVDAMGKLTTGIRGMK